MVSIRREVNTTLHKTLFSYCENRDEKNVKRMHTAVKLNELIQMNSKGSQLVIVNLPPPPKASDGEIRSLQCILDLIQHVNHTKWLNEAHLYLQFS
jgi:hypothetical protein